MHDPTFEIATYAVAIFILIVAMTIVIAWYIRTGGKDGK